MITVAKVVQQLVARSPFISEALSEGLVNVSALARRLQPEVEQRLKKSVKPGAIVMAISRMPHGALILVEKEMPRFFRRVSDVSVRSNLLDYTYANSNTLLRKQARLLDIIGRQPKGFYTFSQGIAETTIIVNEAMEEELEHLLEGERMLDKEQELSVITLMLPEENRSLYGVYYYVLKELAWHGINLVELISTSNEFSVVVKDEDLERAFALISNLRRL